MKGKVLSRKTLGFLVAVIVLVLLYVYTGERQSELLPMVGPAIISGIVAVTVAYLGALVGNAIQKSKLYKPELDHSNMGAGGAK